MASAHDLSAWDKDGRVFLFTSLTAGSSHIITATSRIETILNANRIPFLAIDTATNESARRLWGRRAAGKKLPGLVKEGFVIADLDEVEEWNEFGEIKENIGDVPPASSAPAPGGEAVTTRATMHPTTTAQPPAPLPVKPTATAANKSASDKSDPLQTPMANLSMKEAATEAAAIGAARKGPAPGINDTKVAPLKSPTQTSSLAESSEAPESSKAPEPAPLSAVESSDDLAAAVATPAGTIQQKHRGSSVSNANPEEIKELEQSSAIPEADDEDEEQPKTQEQEAAVADKASVSVQD
ncbi:hypothetical protein D6C86_05786 [Aureobasidium pullulans]|uniref:Thioredoxin-like protein n=3 Tax=Aureobasidium pullulans TaxID=5580 RepID=A0A074Y067_AURPU|nr:uncharacterized protein M438DRAFT_339107 [Aureobasidium pullulans EXF-150]THY76790.1 hypothetical protein D6C94_02811 [Aureobasidium pullulans]KEQ80311.1 hypothetical protein M438DRAFT_339107 [Aureobasidium pullulans EXF-150]THZ46107.1 hypothetical protein D6C87_02385 [Aureobasidium pullulans]THZ59379.1 hypothetical protein D6C86_05786 [Aureobasidium pullulans]TIA00397.1 hypothetical protein D6C88_00195 [Aureobasidium pullulans]